MGTGTVKMVLPDEYVDMSSDELRYYGAGDFR